MMLTANNTGLPMASADLPELLGLHLGSGDGRDHHQRGLRYLDPLHGLGREDRVPGGVHEVQLAVAVPCMRYRGADRDLTLHGLVVEVRDGVALVNLAEAVDSLASNRIAEMSVVLPVDECPTTATFLILSLGIGLAAM